MNAAEEVFVVELYGAPIAKLIRKDDYTRLVFDAEYVQDPQRAVLGLRFEEDLRARNAANMRLPPWFSNLLPEGPLREWISLQRGAPIVREMEMLAEVGHDLPGAVRVVKAEEQSFDDLTPPSQREPGQSNENRGAPPWRFSLAGVALKFSMLAAGDRFTAPASGEAGDWIIKTPDPDYPGVPENELAMMTLAGAVGIEVPEVRLVHRDEITALPERVWHRESQAYAVKRFDRGPNREPIHIEDLAQVRGFYPDEKYSGTFETIASLIYRGRDVEALREFARRLAFNVLIGNGDAHLKNWSLIYRDRRRPTLSPAYDLVATFAYRPEQSGPEDMGLRFGGSKRFDTVSAESFVQLEKRLGVDVGLRDVAVELVDAVDRSWPVAEEILSDDDELRTKVREWIRARSKGFLRRG